jgi:hypothetical protein
MGGISSCNCKKVNENEELNLRNPLDDHVITPQGVDKFIEEEIDEIENGISPKITGKFLERTQHANKNHFQSFSDQYLIDYPDERYFIT